MRPVDGSIDGDRYSKTSSVRKAQMARVLLNFYREQGHPAAKAIPPGADYAFELAVLHAKPYDLKNASIERKREIALEIRSNLQRQKLPDEMAEMLANMVAEVDDNTPEFLQNLMHDVNYLEEMRHTDKFHVYMLKCYGSKTEGKVFELCKEYAQLLSQQGDLHCDQTNQLLFKTRTDAFHVGYPVNKNNSQQIRTSSEKDPELFNRTSLILKTQPTLNKYYIASSNPFSTV